MTLTFKLRFHTKYGQSLWLTGDHEILGGGQVERAIPLQYLNEEFWQATITLPKEPATNVEIQLQLYFARGERSHDSGLGEWPDHQSRRVSRKRKC